jgi:hypothetical protein
MAIFNLPVLTCGGTSTCKREEREEEEDNGRGGHNPEGSCTLDLPTPSIHPSVRPSLSLGFF